MTLRLAISPCPNDTYAFAALLHGWVDTQGITYDVQLLDIEELNHLALTHAADVVKMSYATYAQVQAHYTLLQSGSALGRGVGPLLVARADSALTYEQLAAAPIALPGWHTTAHLLLHHYAPQALQRHVLRFEQIMPAVVAGQYAAGVIIHEGRFTYADHGLVALQDLGAHWEAHTGLPIPLGGIGVRSTLGPAVARAVDQTLQASLRYARAHPAQVMPWVAQHAQEMAPHVQQAHIDLYVNDFTLQLGPEGHRAVQHLLQVAQALPLPTAGR